jgi:hypothetical protein
MGENEAVEFLLKRTSIDDRTNAEIIAERLGYLPLALEQAATYVHESNIDFVKFIELNNKYELKLLDSKYSLDSRKKTIHNVWNITLDSLSDDSKKLLYCFAYMSPECIELSWLTEYARKLKIEWGKPDLLIPQIRKDGSKEKQVNISDLFSKFDTQNKFLPDLVDIMTDDLALIRAVTELKKHSLIVSRKDYSYSMHALLQEIIRNNITAPSYMFSVWEALKTQCNNIDLIYDDYRRAISLSQAEPLVRNVYSFMEYREALSENLDNGDSFRVDIEMWILKFQLCSFIAQYLTLRGDFENDNLLYEEADKYYAKSCGLALQLFGVGENIAVSDSSSFTLIQERHRRMRVNLILQRNDVANKLYEESKRVLINSARVNPEMVKKAFSNYAKLWSEFGFLDSEREAYGLADECSAEHNKGLGHLIIEGDAPI